MNTRWGILLFLLLLFFFFFFFLVSVCVVNMLSCDVPKGKTSANCSAKACHALCKGGAAYSREYKMGVRCRTRLHSGARHTSPHTSFFGDLAAIAILQKDLERDLGAATAKEKKCSCSFILVVEKSKRQLSFVTAAYSQTEGGIRGGGGAGTVRVVAVMRPRSGARASSA